MNCTNVRERLPLLLYKDLSPEEIEHVKEHLTECPACRGDYASLQEIQGMLDRVSSPGVSVSASALFRQAVEIQAAQSRRWRRAAMALAGIAAVVIAVLVFRLEIRLGREQVLISWGNPIPIPDSVTNGKAVSVTLTQTDGPNPPASEAELQPMRGLIYALADDLDKLSREFEARDHRQQQAITRLQENMAQVRLLIQRQLTARQVVLDSSKKGEDQ